jgi:hypothetical protein
MNDDRAPFADLPAALVEELLERAPVVGDNLIGTLTDIKTSREELKSKLAQKGLLISESSLPLVDIPTACAADGSYAIERMLTTDLGVAAAVVVEGLTPPSETRFWAEPRHRVSVFAETHDEDTATVLRALMLGEELTLAADAPHDLVMIDGTLTLPIIYFNQALNAAPGTSLQCGKAFLEQCLTYLTAYVKILSSTRTDKQYIGCPKYSTRREIGRQLGWPESHDDRGLLTLVLDAGQLTRPVPLEQPTGSWHITIDRVSPEIRSQIQPYTEQVPGLLQGVHVLYYRPSGSLPAFRIEVGSATASNPHRLATVIQGIKSQAATGSMLEPYPLYLADRIVKAAARSLPAFRQVATQRIAERYPGDLGEVFFAMHGYRSESGA